MKHLKQQLRAIKTADSQVNPDQAWVVSERARMVQQISNTVVPVAKPVVVDTAHALWYHLRSSSTVRLLRPTLTALTVALLATGGWIASVSASFNSLPGDRLWTIKRVAQKTEVAVKSIGATENEKVQLQLNLAKSRVDDIKKTVSQKLAVESDPNDRAKAEKDLSVAVKDVQDAVKEVSVNVNVQAKDSVTKENAVEVVETAKGVAKDTTVLVKELNSTVASSTLANVEVTKQVIETIKLVNETSITAVETVVKTGEPNDVKNIVSEKVVDLVQSTEAIKNDVKNTLGVPLQPTSASTTKILEVLASTTKNVVLTTTNQKTESLEKALSSTSTSTASDLIKEADARTLVVNNSAVEIKKNIDSNNLEEALKNLKDLNQNAASAQQLLVDTKTKAQSDQVQIELKK